MVDKTKNTKKDDNQDNNVVSPTQAQMDEWVKEELAEADQDDMLSKDGGALFPDESSKSID